MTERVNVEDALDQLVGREITSARVTTSEDPVCGIDLELAFADGGSVILQGWDYEGYASGIYFVDTTEKGAPRVP